MTGYNKPKMRLRIFVSDYTCMFKSKTSYRNFSIAFMAFAIGLAVNIFIQWNSLMESNRMRLFIYVVWAALFTFKAIDYFLEWRNFGKPKSVEE